MKFKVIDQYTVRCVLTEDDMIENDIELEDFFHNREKVHNLLEVIMDKAKDEVGYELNEEILSMQIMPLPKNGLAITLSGKNEQEVNDIITNVKNLASIMGEDLETNEDGSNDDNSDILQGTVSHSNSELFNTNEFIKKSARKNAREVEKPDPKDGFKVYRFTSLIEVEGFCKTMQHPKYVMSHLYKNIEENCYYLAIEQGRLTRKTFNNVCDIAIEFADVLSHESSSMAYISEHYEKFINKNAISIMRKIASVK